MDKTDLKIIALFYIALLGISTLALLLQNKTGQIIEHICALSIVYICLTALYATLKHNG
jgi:hypothetical protein